MARKPPLDVVRVVRERSVDDAASALRDAASEAETARAKAERVRELELAERQALDAAKSAELAALSNEMCAADLAQLAAFEHGASLKIDRIARQAAAAETHADETKSEEQRRRDELVGARRALDVVEKHQQRWRQARDRQEQEKIDEGAEESFAARRPRK